MTDGWLIFFATVGATAMTQTIIAAFVYGKLTESVTGLKGGVANLWTASGEHSRKLDNHEQRISHLEGRHK